MLYYFQTDTASVLMEAIAYIKILQEQIEVRFGLVRFNSNSQIMHIYAPDTRSYMLYMSVFPSGKYEIITI